jgi:hypothetical protein
MSALFTRRAARFTAATPPDPQPSADALFATDNLAAG